MSCSPLLNDSFSWAELTHAALLPRCCVLMQKLQEYSALWQKNSQRWSLMADKLQVLCSAVTLGQGRPPSVPMVRAQPPGLMRVNVWEAGIPRSWPINSFEVFAVRVLLLRLQGLRILQEVFIPLVLRLDVGADGGGALALKASGQSCRTEAEEKQVQLGDSNRKKSPTKKRI